MPGLVLMLKENAILDYDPEQKDWRFALFARVTEWIQEHDELEYVPVIAYDDRNDSDQAKYIWSLAEFMKVTDADLPAIFMIDPHTQKSIPFPVKMDKIENFSPELVISWANYQNALIDEQVI